MIITQDELNRRLNSRNNLLAQLRAPSEGATTPVRPSGDNGAVGRKEQSGTTAPASPSNSAPIHVPAIQQDPSIHVPDPPIQHQAASEVKKVGRPPKSLNAAPKPDNSLRVVAGILASHDKPAIVRQEFGLSQTQLNSARNSQDSAVRQRINDGKDRVSELALNQLMGTLGLLTPDRIEQEKPKDQAAIAASLSRVVTNMAPKVEQTSDPEAVKIIIFSPQQKTEEKYTVIDV